MLLVGVGPGPVKNVFTVRVRLQVKSTRGHQPGTVVKRHKTWRPAGVRNGAATGLHGRQILMAHERIECPGRVLSCQQFVPLKAINRLWAVQHPNDIIVWLVFQCRFPVYCLNDGLSFV